MTSCKAWNSRSLRISLTCIWITHSKQSKDIHIASYGIWSRGRRPFCPRRQNEYLRRFRFMISYYSTFRDILILAHHSLLGSVAPENWTIWLWIPHQGSLFGALLGMFRFARRLPLNQDFNNLIFFLSTSWIFFIFYSGEYSMWLDLRASRLAILCTQLLTLSPVYPISLSICTLSTHPVYSLWASAPQNFGFSSPQIPKLRGIAAVLEIYKKSRGEIIGLTRSLPFVNRKLDFFRSHQQIVLTSHFSEIDVSIS